MIETRIEPELMLRVRAFFGAPGDADDATPANLRDLADERTDGAGRRSDDERLAGRGFPDLEQSRVRGQPRHAEDAERGRERRDRGIDLSQTLAARDRVLLPPRGTLHVIARREPVDVRGDDFVNRPADHDGTDFDRRRIRFRGIHPPAHVRIEREKERAQQHFARTGLADRFFLEAKVGRSGFAVRSCGEHDAVISNRSGHIARYARAKGSSRLATTASVSARKRRAAG